MARKALATKVSVASAIGDLRGDNGRINDQHGRPAAQRARFLGKGFHRDPVGCPS